MAITQGHGNPNWTRDETILALDLYLASGVQMPSPRSPEVIALSSLLRSLPYHAEAAKKPSFRNPDGVAFKLQNIRQVATGKGLGNVSQTDRTVWADFGHRRGEVTRLSQAIRAGIVTEASLPLIQDDEFIEGRLLTIIHCRRERDPKLRRKLLDSRVMQGLACDACGLTRPDLPVDLQEALFEAHHVLPLASGQRVTRLSDLAVLCACCHRAVHRLMVTEKRAIPYANLENEWPMSASAGADTAGLLVPAACLIIKAGVGSRSSSTSIFH
jgi:5-methylcytosine-specific restriction protein A